MNRLKAHLRSGQQLAGTWIGLDSCVSIEIAGRCGFDWAVLDLEHGHFPLADVQGALRAAEAVALDLVVRVPDAQAPLIGRLLDWGCAGIMVPSIDSAAQARTVVDGMRFAPLGRRGLSRSVRAAGFGDAAQQFVDAQAEVLAIVQIESPAAVKNVHDIAAIDGIDVLFLGHTDLCQALGCLNNRQDPRILAAEEQLLVACAAHEKQAGMALTSPNAARDAAARGFQLVTVASDVGLLCRSMRAARATVDDKQR